MLSFASFDGASGVLAMAGVVAGAEVRAVIGLGDRAVVTAQAAGRSFSAAGATRSAAQRIEAWLGGQEGALCKCLRVGYGYGRIKGLQASAHKGGGARVAKHR